MPPPNPKIQIKPNTAGLIFNYQSLIGTMGDTGWFVPVFPAQVAFYHAFRARWQDVPIRADHNAGVTRNTFEVINENSPVIVSLYGGAYAGVGTGSFGTVVAGI